MILEREARYSIDEHGAVTHGNLKDFLSLLDDNAAGQVGLIDRGPIQHCFFPVAQFVVDEGHMHVPVTRVVPQIQRSRSGLVTWEPMKANAIFDYCTDGVIHSGHGGTKQRARMDWFLFASRPRIDKFLPRPKPDPVAV